MPTPPKRPPFFAAPLLALFLAAAPAAHAQTAVMAFAEADSLAPLDVFDARPVAPGGDGARVFKLDLIYKTGSAPVAGISAYMHILERDVEIVEISNVLPARLIAPATAGLYLEDRKAALAGVEYAKAYGLGWAAINFIPGITSADAYVRLLTATVKLKKTAGNTTVNFSGSADSPIAGKQLTIRGPSSG